MSERPVYCCGKCPEIVGGGFDCTCRENPRCETWNRYREVRELTGLTLEQRVQEWMSPENLKVEGKSEGKWIEID